jgi:hypothetical protein
MFLVLASVASAVTLSPLGSWTSGVFAEGAAEISAFDPETARLFVVNASTSGIDVLDLSDPSAPVWVGEIAIGQLGGQANSVAFKDGVLAAAIESKNKQAPGVVAFFEADGTLLSSVTVGALPDMITFTPDGERVIVACEGEPHADYLVDPEGSVAIVDLRAGVDRLTDADVTLARFRAWHVEDLDDSVRVFGPGATVAMDVEPEYVAVSHDSKTAWVTLQENNAIAVVDVVAGEVLDVIGLGWKDHRTAGLDPSDKDGGAAVAGWPVRGLYLPDAIGAVHHRGDTFLVTANEGDSRDYDGFGEEARVGAVNLDPGSFQDPAGLKTKEQLGRLKITTTLGDPDGDGDYDALYSFGARSISVWNAAGALVWDGGDELERLLADEAPDLYNADHEENGADARSDDKGPEPEGLVTAKLWGNWYAFVGLERAGGVVVYDLSDPTAPVIDDYVNVRDPLGDPELGTAGDLGPEGLIVIPAEDSPDGWPLLVVSHEISGSVRVFRIGR